MENLVDEVKESCSAAVLDGGDIVYVLRVHTHKIMSTNLGVGSRLPACWTSMGRVRSEEHTSELQSPCNLVCRLLLEKKNKSHDASTTNSHNNFTVSPPTQTFSPRATLFQPCTNNHPRAPPSITLYTTPLSSRQRLST